VPGRLALADVFLRRYPAAEVAARRSLALEPSNLFNIENRALIALAKGDLAGARAAIHAMPAPVDTAALVAYLAEWWDLGWVLDTADEQVLLRLRPDAFDNSRSSWAIVLAEQYALRGDMVRARIYADSTLIGFDTHLKATPADWGGLVGRALALAYLGRKDAAIDEVGRAMALRPISKDAFLGPYIQHQAVRVYILVGEKEKALDLLEPLLRIPYYLSPAWLRIDPNFLPLHGNPRFERLIAQPAGDARPTQ
jgi:tetratricopeptide (TPR) repeat protein